MESADLKIKTARTIKWNLVDRVATQVLYGVTGIVLARLLNQEDFGLVGAVLVFQAFASILVDSGFSSALIQRKSPTQLDYSTVMWFNVLMGVVLYAILWVSAPGIAWIFKGDERLIPLSRVMFVSMVFQSTAIVQTNRLMKRMDVRMIAASNVLGLTIGAIVGIWMALAGYGAWAIVWQTIVVSAVKSLTLWLTGGWLPLLRFSCKALRSFVAVGSGVMATSMLNTIFQNIYSLFIGNRTGMVSLGYYTQADKWSKMGVMSISQVLTSSFLPVLSGVQDDTERFARVSAKTSRFTGYITLPALGILCGMSTAIFHCLFGVKWDASIALFQLLLLRGVFFVMTSLYNQYILAKGDAKMIVYMEILRDGVSLLALLIALPFIGMTAEGDPVLGIRWLLWGQVAASVVTWMATLVVASRRAGRSAWAFVMDLAPYTAFTLVAMGAMWLVGEVIENCWGEMFAQGLTGLLVYMGACGLAGSSIQREAIGYALGRFKRKN